MRCPYRNDDYRRHFQAQRRALMAPQHDYDGKGPVYRTSGRGARAYAELVRYAAALGRTRGQLPENLVGYNAFAIRNDDGTARVYFTRAVEVMGRYGPEWRLVDQDDTSIAVELRHLDWQPDDPIEDQNLMEAA